MLFRKRRKGKEMKEKTGVRRRFLPEHDDIHSENK
jgi:hypothetical protein